MTAPLLLGLLGDDRVYRSPSPKMHSLALSAAGLEGYYVPLRSSAEELPGALDALHRLNFLGLNVTAPLKERALKLATVADPEAESVGAANTLKRIPSGGWAASNTDLEGFARAFLQGDVEGPALLLGAGGAARAVLAALKRRGLEVFVAARDPEKARNLARAFQAESLPWGELPLEFGLAANACSTSAREAFREPLARLKLKKGALVADLNYGRADNYFLDLAREKDARFHDGLSMLAEQARLSFLRWSDLKDISIDPFRRGAIVF
ncbi:MAG: shikimate dehydrogenase [Deltaproteobacteria bacterium]|jgi:shikimate dehydrogenase|nr:shikimate dehydrogenase [Deltaproteobacteria bacterium]